ncbi:MAG: L-threonylcarbamoyladenylate synthase [Pseudomonadota bacterium]
MPVRETQVLTPDRVGIGRAAELLQQGGLVAFPTETVYGLGANARNGQAVAGIFAAKDRPRFNPLIVHVASLDAAHEIGVIEGDALRLAGAFWPGPLSLVVPVRGAADLSDLVTAGLSTVAIRVPELPLSRGLLTQAGVPVAAPSANPSGRISPTRADHVIDALSGRIDAVLDGGPCTVGLESTIIAAGVPPRLLRPGGIPAEAIEACLGCALALGGDGSITAPGQLASHYAPRGKVRLDADGSKADEAMLGFGSVPGDLNLSPAADLAEAAANLFQHMRLLDDGRDLAIAPIPDTGLGRAINDRLRRAAADR